MTRLERTLVRLDNDLEALDAGWALVGGLAVGARAEPRTTRDVDVAVAVPSDREAEELVFALRRQGYREAEPPVFEQTAQGRLATVRLYAPAKEPGLSSVVDFLFASSGIEAEIVAAAEPLELVEGLVVPVARVGHLLALKVLAMSADRPQDFTDAKALLREADDAEVQRARDALALIDERGFARGKDLQAELGRVL